MSGMPRLTPDNLNDLARKARAHVFGVEDAPQSVEELRGRLAALPAERCPAFAHGFGPSAPPDCHRPGGGYCREFSFELLDAASVPSEFRPDEVVTVEAQLAELLDRVEQSRSDIVVILHPWPGRGDDKQLAALDGDFRDCLRRVGTGP